MGIHTDRHGEKRHLRQTYMEKTQTDMGIQTDIHGEDTDRHGDTDRHLRATDGQDKLTSLPSDVPAVVSVLCLIPVQQASDVSQQRAPRNSHHATCTTQQSPALRSCFSQQLASYLFCSGSVYTYELP